MRWINFKGDMVEMVSEVDQVEDNTKGDVDEVKGEMKDRADGRVDMVAGGEQVRWMEMKMWMIRRA